MTENELVVYHIVTRNKMRVGQIIDFSENQKNTLYHFFFEKEQLNSKEKTLFKFFKTNIQMKGLT